MSPPTHRIKICNCCLILKTITTADNICSYCKVVLLNIYNQRNKKKIKIIPYQKFLNELIYKTDDT